MTLCTPYLIITRHLAPSELTVVFLVGEPDQDKAESFMNANRGRFYGPYGQSIVLLGASMYEDRAEAYAKKLASENKGLQVLWPAIKVTVPKRTTGQGPNSATSPSG